MGKVPTAAAAAAEMKRKKKKGRPPKKNSILPSAPPKPINYDSTPTTSRRSGRRNPNNFNSPPPEFDVGDDDDERKEKKVKLVVRLPPSDENTKINQKQQHSRDYNSASGSGSGSDPESEDREAYDDKRKINAGDRGSDNAASVQEKKIVKVTDTSLHGSPMESGPTTTPLPDKKLLLFVLDRLQKKDTYGVFSEPVDIDELPDYLEIVEQPMDFGTVRKKLDDGIYKTLEQLEGDVFLICSNAMLYNASDTVYHRQARTIQDLAKRDFENLRHEGDNGEPQPKVVRRGRPPSNKNQKKFLETSPVNRVDLPSGAALNNSGEEKAVGSNSYNLRKAPALQRYRSSDLYVSPYRPRNGENYSEWLADWNDEFPASILRADMKYGKKQFTVDENRRDTYRQFHPVSCGNNNSPALSSSIEDMKRLVPVGVQEPLAYARSLARYAANLGPIAWKIASKRIEHAIPPGTQYAPGWVGEIGPASHSHPLSFSTGDYSSSNKLPNTTTPSTSASEGIMEAVRKLNTQNDASVSSPSSLWRTPFPSVQQKPLYHFDRNGIAEMTERAPPEMWSFGKSTWPKQQNRSSGAAVGPPDLNVRVLAGSPTTSSTRQQIGSPQQQPDLALQL